MQCSIQKPDVVVAGGFIYLQQEKETGASYPKLCLREGALTIAYVHCWVNYMCVSWPHLSD